MKTCAQTPKTTILWSVLLLLGTCLVACEADEADDENAKGARTEPLTKFLPEATGSCPGFAEGDGCERDGSSLVCTFQPEDVELPRKVRVWFDAEARDDDRALVFFFHGLGGAAANAEPTFGSDVVDDMLASGAVLVAPEKEEGRPVGLGSLPWLGALGAGRNDDFLVMDEILACAEAALGIDERRIHVSGMSAGGLQSGQVVVKRSGYIASAVLFSGAIAGEPPESKVQDPANKLPVAIFHGGPEDIVSPLMFQDEAERARQWLDDHGHFSIFCDHGMRHTVPRTAAEAAWQFMQDHPFGSVPSPYADGIPQSFPAADYCEL